MSTGSLDIVIKYLLSDILPSPKGKLSPEEEDAIQAYRHQRTEIPLIFIGSGTCGRAAGALKTKKIIAAYLELTGTEAEIIETGCIGLCSMEPIVDIQLPGKTRVSYGKVTPDNVHDILDATFNHNIYTENILGQYREPELEAWGKVPALTDLRFFKKQYRLCLENTGIIDPGSIEEYIARGGYKAFIKTIFSYSPEQVCDLIEKSNLRGRGGAAFPTARKWKTALTEAAEQKYIICNADESDPGAFISRGLLEGNPHKIIEGLAIAAYAIGASKAFIYIRHEYHLAAQRVKKALEQARECELLGPDVVGSGFGLTIQLKVSPGAFVCGEETALINCLEGKRGMPRSKPPYPAVEGLFGKPTVVNNVETLACIPSILEKGPQWFDSLGVNNSKGTKILTLAGKTKNIGLVEVEMGTSFRDLIYSIGEGIRENKPFKALHIGGPSGHCLGTGHLDVTIDFESLQSVSASLGSGGVIVLDESACMIDLAKFYLDYLKKESCGKCIPCREGNKRMSEILENITRRPVKESGHETLERFKGIMQLESLAEVIRDTSLCGLGKNAPNPVLSSLKHFRDEYEEHIFDRKCRAGVCNHLRLYIIDTELCTGCAACARKCPAAAIIGAPTQAHFIIEEKCTGCGICYENCKFVAISVK
jgi:NADH:ubiquinone oxidoreductase subunit F (NADH-binding)/Pyruvate/2-oxoacid:ferredoxin oxidoreductase delta subunit/(2Fe-2S) ferredoxin